MTFKIMSARKFLNDLPSIIKDGNESNHTICISHGFLKRIQKEMRMNGDELTNIYIFCNSYVLDPKEQKNSGIYLRYCIDHYEVIFIRLHKPFFSADDLCAIAETGNASIDTFLMNKKPKVNEDGLVFMSMALWSPKLYFI